VVPTLIERLIRSILGVLFMLSISACSPSPDSIQNDAPAPPGRDGCWLSSKGVPSCGVLWGVSARPHTVRRLNDIERAAGRPFDLVYRYHDVYGVVPDRQERDLVAQGRLLHVSIAARDFSKPDVRIPWADIARGEFDRSLLAQARGIALLKAPVLVTFEQEADQKEKLGVAGNAHDFVAAWRHLHELYRSVGASNAVWTWVMTGYPENITDAGSLWPGNDVVDWISWNVYNQSGCKDGFVDANKISSFEDQLRPFYDFIQQRGPALGIDASKPMMISETGSVTYAASPELTADWYAAIPSTLDRYPQVKGVTLWNSVSEPCDYVFDGNAVVSEGVRRAGLDPVLDTRGALSRRR